MGVSLLEAVIRPTANPSPTSSPLEALTAASSAPYVNSAGGSPRTPSLTIAPRNPAKGVLNFVVTLTTHKDVRSYPCRSMESAIKLAERFIAGVTKPARPSTPEAETNPHRYDGPPRTAEQVAA